MAKVVIEGSQELRSDLRKLPQLQREDNQLRLLIDQLERPTEGGSRVERLRHTFTLHENTLFQKTPGIEQWRACVPNSLKERLTSHYHEDLGHFGAEKVHAALKETFYWKNMGHDIRKTLRKCDLCQKSKHPNHALHGSLEPILATHAGELVAIDLYGPLPQSRGGVCYILVCLDVFTKFVALYPLKRATTISILNRLINNYIPSVIKPAVILCDHGSQFTSRSWYKTLTENGIRNRHTSIRHPQSNPSERVMRELGRLFRAYCHDRHTSWATFVPEISQWLNCTTHSGTGFTPYE